MFRTYADPHKAEERLEEAQKDLEEMIEHGDSDEAIYDQKCWVEELKEKVNFAWQDEEASEMGWDY